MKLAEYGKLNALRFLCSVNSIQATLECKLSDIIKFVFLSQQHWIYGRSEIALAVSELAKATALQKYKIRILFTSLFVVVDTLSFGL